MNILRFPFLFLILLPFAAVMAQEEGFWPNGSFELGVDLDQPTGSPDAWFRGGDNPALCVVSSDAASSGLRSLAVYDDDSAGYGEWYSPLELAGNASPGDTLTVRWRELYQINGGEMRLTVLFFNAENGIAAQHHYVVRDESDGWGGSVATSTFTLREEMLNVPAGATRMQAALVSGGSLETTGFIVIDDLMVARPAQAEILPGNFWINPTFEEGENLDAPEGTPTGWNRGGNQPALCVVASSRSVSPTHALAVFDEDPAGYGEWYADFDLVGHAGPGDLLNVQWHQIHQVSAGGEMRLTVLFFNDTATVVGEHHFVVQGDSPGWTGDLASSGFEQRRETLTAPEGAAQIRCALVSGGSLETTGLLVIDDLSLAVAEGSDLLSGNFWPNPGFEEGVALDTPEGTPDAWSRGGNEPTINIVSSDAAQSGSRSLALHDESAAGYGEWYADLPLDGLAAPGDLLNFQWFELYNVSDGGEMRVTVLTFDAEGGIASEEHFVVSGQSPGWTGDPAASTFTRRTGQIVTPASASRLRIALVSGGPLETTGSFFIDDLSVAVLPPGMVLPGNFWPNSTFELGVQLDDPAAGQPSGWNRGGSNSSIDQVLTSAHVSPTHSLAVVDDDPNGYGEWYRSIELAGLASSGDELLLQWFELYQTTGDMRLTILFFDGTGAVVGENHFIVNGESDGWDGDLASSQFTERGVSLFVPEGAARLQISLVSGGGFEVTGIFVIDDLSVAVAVSVPIEITSFHYLPGENQFRIEWRSSAMQSYALRYSSDIIDWTQEVESGIPGEGALTSITFTHPGIPDLYFRVEED